MIVRKAERRDAETLFEFVLRLDGDGAPVRGPQMSVDDIMAAGFGPDPLFEAFIAETDAGVPLGAVSFYRGYSGWYAKSLAMAHLLFVTEAARGKGIGLKLMAAVADVAVKRNWVRIELIVEEDRPVDLQFPMPIGVRMSGKVDHDARALPGVAEYFVLGPRPMAIVS